MLGSHVNQMGNRWDALALLRRRGREQRTGSHEQDVTMHALLNFAQNFRAKHRRRTPAARPAGVYILTLGVENQVAAVLVQVAQGDAVRLEEFGKQLAPNLPQVAGQNQKVTLVSSLLPSTIIF